MDRIALFAYNFPHKKTQDFIFRILAEGFKIFTIYAADPIKLNIPASSIKTKINHIGLMHPSEIAKNFGIRYVVTPHNEKICSDLVENNISLGIISGARILKSPVIKCFRRGIINFHPGLIPEARGLDALLWSIYNNVPLGVTSHLINDRIDAGCILEKREIPLYKSDTILDLSERLYDLQLDMISVAITRAIKGEAFKIENYHVYNRKMPVELEQEVLNKLDQYLLSFTK